MRLVSVLLAFTTLVCVMADSKGACDDKVRVKLLRLSLPLEIEGPGIVIRNLNSSGLTKISIPQNEHTTIDMKVVAGERVWLIQRNNSLGRFSLPYLEVQSAATKIRIGGYEVPTPILLSPKTTLNSVDVIAALKLDDYLAGVLSGEMPTTWPLEALKAQAVAARSYTLFQVQSHRKAPYQLEGSVLDQVFSVSLPPSQMEKIHKALDETKDMVLTKNHRVIKAYYHSDCGGQTEDPSAIWGGGKIKTGKYDSVIDAQCAFNPAAKWEYEISLDDLTPKLQTLDPKLGDLKTVRVVTRTPSQRVGLLAFNDGAKEMKISGNDFRSLIGYSKLKSTLFSVSQKENKLVFTGRGFGHGSGLCQWGAKFMAENGAKAQEILHHYYPSAQLVEAPVADHVADR